MDKWKKREKKYSFFQISPFLILDYHYIYPLAFLFIKSLLISSNFVLHLIATTTQRQHKTMVINCITISCPQAVQFGQDPENQLCTDDFAGHWAHSANLSVKAIMGVAGYSEMARMLGLNDVADKYAATAKKMAVKWEEMANEGDHYRLAFDRKDTWSQKYNMVWDKLWDLKLFPNNVIGKEINYYLTKQNPYGLPLDSRKEYTKSDWIMWTAAMSSDKETFQKLSDPVYKYINETVSRVPISDWHHTDSGRWVGFRARSVIGGYWMKVLMDKVQNNQ